MNAFSKDIIEMTGALLVVPTLKGKGPPERCPSSPIN